jgi:hypothetical protein
MFHRGKRAPSSTSGSSEVLNTIRSIARWAITVGLGSYNLVDRSNYG